MTREMIEIADENIVFDTRLVNLIKINDNTIGIMYFYYNWNLDRSDHKLSMRVRVVDLNNPTEKRELTVGNQYDYDSLYYDYGIPFINANTYKIAKIDEDKIFFEEMYPKIEATWKKIFERCLMGSVGGGILCSGYYLHNINLIDEHNKKTILDKSVDLVFLEKNYDSFNNIKLSTNKDFLIYDISSSKYDRNPSSGDIYVLSTSTGRKKLIEKNARPLYME